MAKFLGLFGRKNVKKEAIEAYNLGLAAKYEGDWDASFAHNLRASELNNQDEATWWNLGIAATALRDWDTARRAWLACGIPLESGDGEVSMANGWGCVRLVPNGAADVVWGKRLDPARTRVVNVPLPRSERRYGDIVLNDGASEGTRTWDSVEYPVLNELALWQVSAYSTYAIEVEGATEGSDQILTAICNEHDLWFEDWGTVRILCAECSQGNPGEHVCTHTDGEDSRSRFGFAAKDRIVLERAIAEWKAIEPQLRFGELTLEVAGTDR